MIERTTDWESHIDAYGMIVQKLGDAGDTAQRMGMFWLGNQLRIKLGLDPVNVANIQPPIPALDMLECPDCKGNYRRTPDESQRHSACDRCTRDQATGIASLMLASNLRYGHYSRVLVRKKVKSFMWNMLKRGWFTNNSSYHGWEKDDPRVGTSRSDFGGFSLMALCIRAGGWWWLWPLLVLLDCDILFGGIRHRYFSDTDDVLNHVLRSCAAGLVLPTPTSWLANKINDPNSLGVKLIQYFWRVLVYDDGVTKDYGPPMWTVYDADFLRKVMG